MPKSKREKRVILQQQTSSFESFRNRALVADNDLTASFGYEPLKRLSSNDSFGRSLGLSGTTASNVINDVINEQNESGDELDKSLNLHDETKEDLRRSLIPSFNTPQLTALHRLSKAVKTAAVTNELLSLLNDSVAKAEVLKDQVGQSSKETGSHKFKAAAEAITLLNNKRIQTVSSHPRNAGEYTVIAFVNSASGGGKGEKLYKTLQGHLGESYVVDLKSCRPGHMPEDTLVQYATDPMVRVLACGGDGTCGWIFSSLDKVWLRLLGERSPTSRIHLSKYKDHLPMAIMPLGTGNDLSRQFHWGGKFNESMTKRSMIQSVQQGRLAKLDRWRVIIMPFHQLSEEEKLCIPSILSGSDDINTTDKIIDEILVEQTDVAGNRKSRAQTKKAKSSKRPCPPQVPSTQFFDGVFCNYMSLGFDATIAYLFHHEREEHPEKFTSPLKNKLIYVQKSPAAFRAPKLRGKMKIKVAREDGELVSLPIPKSCRAVILMNIRSYGGGNHLSTEGSPTDGLIEVTSVGIGKVLPFMLFNVAAQTNRVIFRTTAPLHCQVDGEPWLQSDGVIQVKFHARNAILEKVKEKPNSCDCTGGAQDAVIQ